VHQIAASSGQQIPKSADNLTLMQNTMNIQSVILVCVNLHNFVQMWLPALHKSVILIAVSSLAPGDLGRIGTTLKMLHRSQEAESDAQKLQLSYGIGPTTGARYLESSRNDSSSLFRLQQYSQNRIASLLLKVQNIA